MKSYYSKKQYLTTYQMDASNKLGLQPCMGMLQDIATEHCINLGWGHPKFMLDNSAFWVITKIKLHINQMPTTGDTVAVKTWMAKPTAVKFERDFSVSNGKICLVSGKSEWVVLDKKTHRPRGVKTMNYPNGLKYLPTRAIDARFEQINLDLQASKKCLTRTIYYGDTDLNHHTNNCVYSRFVLDCFDEEFLQKNKLTEYEIHFINESHAGEVLDFYKREDGNISYVEARVADKPIVRAKLTFASM